MPIYDYVCTACGHRMEVVHGIHGHGPETCPVCGGPMRKAFVVPAVHFKGSGWAKKDRGAAGATKAAAKSAAAATSGPGADKATGTSGPAAGGDDSSGEPPPRPGPAAAGGSGD